jgi:hypothetical protein
MHTGSSLSLAEDPVHRRCRPLAELNSLWDLRIYPEKVRESFIVVQLVGNPAKYLITLVYHLALPRDRMHVPKFIQLVLDDGSIVPDNIGAARRDVSRRQLREPDMQGWKYIRRALHGCCTIEVWL